MSPSHVVTPVSSLALHLSLSRTWLYSLTPLSLIVTCHYLSLPLRHTAISDYKMNLMLSAEALREEGAVWGGTDEEKKKNSNSLFSMSFKELSHQRGEAALFLRSSPRSLPIHSLAYTLAISHTQDTHPGCFSLPHPRLSSL